jgi:hypothetical protein
MEVRLTFEKERSSWKEATKKTIFPSQNGKCRMHDGFGGLFKEIPKLISLNNMSLTSILQDSSEG